MRPYRLFLALLFAFILGICSVSPAQDVMMISSGSGRCSAFVVRNRINATDDLVVTAAHCLTLNNPYNPSAIPILTEWGGLLTPVVYGKSDSYKDIAVLKGAVPESYRPLWVALAEPSYPASAYHLGFNIKGKRKVVLLGIDHFGILVGKGFVEPGNSGGPVLYVDAQGREFVVGVVYGMLHNRNGLVIRCHFVSTRILAAAVRRAVQLTRH